MKAWEMQKSIVELIQVPPQYLTKNHLKNQR
jgi:hypothetical protein